MTTNFPSEYPGHEDGKDTALNTEIELAMREHWGDPEMRAALFDDSSEHVTAPVRLKGVRVERSRRFGDVYLALALWRGLGLEELCKRLLPGFLVSRRSMSDGVLV